MGDVGKEVTGSMKSVILYWFKHTLCWHLGILDVKVLVKICLHLVHL